MTLAVLGNKIEKNKDIVAPLNLSLDPLEVNQQILQPESRALSDSRELRRLVVSET